MDNLKQRRKKLCLSFAKKCIKNEKVKNMFPLRKVIHGMKKRKNQKFQTVKTLTTRYKKSAIPYMVNLLNDENAEKCSVLKNY